MVDISVTAHSGNLRNLLAVLGHQPYPLATGEMIPVVVRATPVISNGVNGHDGPISNGTNGTNGINSINGVNGVNGHH